MFGLENAPCATDEDREAYARSKEPSVDAAAICIFWMAVIGVVALLAWVFE